MRSAIILAAPMVAVAVLTPAAAKAAASKRAIRLIITVR